MSRKVGSLGKNNKWTSHAESRDFHANKRREYWRTHDPFKETSHKTCKACGLNKVSTEFIRSIHNKNGLSPNCKDCWSCVYPTNAIYRLYHNAKKHAKELNLEFSISKSDIIIPTICPVLGIPIIHGKGWRTDNSPSLDRRDNSKGYTKDNVEVVSWRANDIKRTTSIRELELLLKYMKQQ